MIKFKKSDVSDFFLNEAHPYSKTRTIKFQHVAVAIGVLAIIVLMIGTFFDKRAQHELEVNQAAKDAKSSSSIPNAEAGAKPQAATNNQNAFISLQTNSSNRVNGGSGRQFSASQIIQRGGSSADVLPIGTQIHVQLFGQVESMDANSPVTAIILEDALSPVQAMVIPKGTKVIGTGQLDSQRERLQVQFRTLVFPEGEQYSISGLAVMPDGLSGLAGDFSSGEFKKNASQFVGNFVGGLASGMEDRAAVGQIGIPFETGSLKNGLLNGVATSSLNYAKSATDKMGQVSASIKVASGTSFVLYLEKGVSSMSMNKKDQKPNGDSHMPVAGLLLLLFLATMNQLWRTILQFWNFHKITIILSLGLIILLGTTFVCSKVWNWYAKRHQEKSITSGDKTSVFLGADVDHGGFVHLKQPFRTMHTQVIGTTNAGKTESVILPWAIQDIKSGSGVLIIDGKADISFVNKLYSYVKLYKREKDFHLFSLANLGPSSSFNPLKGKSAQEVTERVFSSFTLENEYYKNIQYKLFLGIVRLIFAQNEIPTFLLVQRLLVDVDELRTWVEKCPDELLKKDMARFLLLSNKEREERVSGLETMLSHFTASEASILFEESGHSIDFDEALATNKIIYFQLPTMYYPILAAATGKLVLQCFQNAVSKRQIYLDVASDAKPKFFSCILDDFQDYIYEGFGSLLNKSRSANVGVVFSHQALGDLDKVSEAFRNLVLTNTNVKVVMRMNDPETCDHFANTFGTKTTTKITEKTKDGGSTGDGTVRDVEQYNFHPNVFKKLGTGFGVVSIPHRDGVINLKVKFSMRPDLEHVQLPHVVKFPNPVAFMTKASINSDEPIETDFQSAP